MLNYPQLYALASQGQQIEPKQGLAQIGKNLLAYLLSRCCFFHLQNNTIYEEIKGYMSSNIVKILNLNMSELQLYLILGSFAMNPSYLEKLQIIEKELSQMVTEEDITNPNSFVYEEASISSAIFSSVQENDFDEPESLELKAIKSSMSQLSFYDVLDTLEKEKELIESANEYLRSITSYNTELNLLVQKMKVDLGDWEKQEHNGRFKVKNIIKVPVDYTFRNYEGYGEGKSIKLAKEEASKQILEQVYKNSPYFMHEMQKITIPRK